MTVYPDVAWDRADPGAVGVDPDGLATAKADLEERAGDDPYRAVVVREGRVIAEWNEGIERDERVTMSSADKSVLSCLLGIAVEEGAVASPDARVADYYPAAMEVLPGEGPKENRHARAKDRAITFRQCLSNTSGYQKPGEQPGETFHYQTFGMTIAMLGIARAYGCFDLADLEGSPGVRRLKETRLRKPMLGTWEYYAHQFDLENSAARQEIYDPDVEQWIAATALDMARLGWLWCRWGAWKNQQLVPEGWLREATATAREIEEHEDRERWRYGYGFWTNDHRELWPSLPAGSFAASGAGKIHVWVWPPEELVVVQAPGVHGDQADLDEHFLPAVVDAVA